MKEIAAVQHGNDLHARGQDAVVEFVHLLVNGQSVGSSSAPFRNNTAPWITSGSSMMRPSSMWLALAMWPSRILGPWLTSAMSLTRRAVPVCVFKTVCSMSDTLL